MQNLVCCGFLQRKSLKPDLCVCELGKEGPEEVHEEQQCAKSGVLAMMLHEERKLDAAHDSEVICEFVQLARKGRMKSR